MNPIASGSWRPPRRLRWALLIAWNVPVIAAWGYITSANPPVHGAIPALYVLLLLGAVGLIILPILLGDARHNPWLLITSLGLGTLFWSLTWISIYANPDPDPPYAVQRWRLLGAMLLTLTTILLIYLAVVWTLRGHRPPGERHS